MRAVKRPACGVSEAFSFDTQVLRIFVCIGVLDRICDNRTLFDTHITHAEKRETQRVFRGFCGEVSSRRGLSLSLLPPLFVDLRHDHPYPKLLRPSPPSLQSSSKTMLCRLSCLKRTLEPARRPAKSTKQRMSEAVVASTAGGSDKNSDPSLFHLPPLSTPQKLHHCTLLIKTVPTSQLSFEKGESNLRVDLSSFARRRRAQGKSTATAAPKHLFCRQSSSLPRLFSPRIAHRCLY